MLEVALNNYTLDCENPDLNYQLGLEYEKVGQTAAAISFFLRAAERSSNSLLRYECLIRIGNCFDRQQNRSYTVKSMYRTAISILPDRPEAYYMLAKYLAYEQNYSECYLFCDLALLHCKDREYEDLGVGYPGIWGIYYQYAQSSWWYGKAMKCRKIVQNLVSNYWNKMDNYHKNSVENMLTSFGAGPESHVFRVYRKELHKKLRFKFNGCGLIDRNYSQVYQDMFVLSMLNGKTNGRFLEIGGADPWKGNNTALLEMKFGWKGTSIEIKEEFAKAYKMSRPNINVYNTDALSVNYDEILFAIADNGVVDYLQLDIEPARNTYDCMLKIPFDRYKFRVITYEHDYPADVTRQYREKSREFLKSKGYELIVNDVSADGEWNFEDWWVHPDLVDPVIKEKMKCVSENKTKIEDYFLSANDVEVNMFAINRAKFAKRAFVVDNFYEDPMAVRQFAQQQEYIDGGLGRGFIGKRTAQQFLFPGLKETFEDIMQKKITAWQEYGMNGRFQLNIGGEQLVYHCDYQKYAAMIYLTPNAPPSCGTSTFMHRATRTYHNSDPNIDKVFYKIKTTMDGTPYDNVDKFGNIFNRLVIFDAGCIHAASEYFGADMEDGRLWHMFFFDA